MLLYADDIFLFCEDVQDLQSILKIYDEIFSRFGLTIGAEKIQTLSFNVPSDKCKITNITKRRTNRKCEKIQINGTCSIK